MSVDLISEWKPWQTLKAELSLTNKFTEASFFKLWCTPLHHPVLQSVVISITQNKLPFSVGVHETNQCLVWWNSYSKINKGLYIRVQQLLTFEILHAVDGEFKVNFFFFKMNLKTLQQSRICGMRKKKWKMQRIHMYALEQTAEPIVRTQGWRLQNAVRGSKIQRCRPANVLYVCLCYIYGR